MKKFSLCFLCCFCLAGCAGLADYAIPLENGYQIVRSSAHQIQIVGDEPVEDGQENVYNYFYVPAKVAAVWQNDQYLIVKQLELIPDERGYMEPPKAPTDADYSYWIIETEKHTVTGPLPKNKFEEFKQDLGIKIKFTTVEKLKKNAE